MKNKQIEACSKNLKLMDIGQLQNNRKRIMVIDDEYFNCDAIK